MSTHDDVDSQEESGFAAAVGERLGDLGEVGADLDRVRQLKDTVPSWPAPTEKEKTREVEKRERES